MCSSDAISDIEECQASTTIPLSVLPGILSGHNRTATSYKDSFAFPKPLEESFQFPLPSEVSGMLSEEKTSRDATIKLKRTRSDSLEDTSDEFCCWKHGCEGKRFSTRGNLVRHCLERSKARYRYHCTQCGAEFSRSSARDKHITMRRCNRQRGC
jgi:hypothetical protein